MNDPTSRLELALDMFEVGVEMFRRKTQRTRPELSAEQVSVVVRDWLRSRPGAEGGDVIGSPVSLPR